MSITKQSNHPTKHKHTAFHALAKRATTIPMSEANLNKEFDIIQCIGLNNGYPLHEINAIINKQLNVKNDLNIPQKCKKQNKYVSITFFNNFSNKIGHIFRKHGLEPGFKTTNSIGKKLLSNKKSYNIDPYNNAGIYAISCNDCNKKYIGKTTRNFKTRFKEHIKDNKSNVYQHISTSHHHIDNIDKNLTILHKGNNDRMLCFRKYRDS